MMQSLKPRNVLGMSAYAYQEGRFVSSGHHHPSGRGGGVDVLGDRTEASTSLGDPLHDMQHVFQRAGQAIEFQTTMVSPSRRWSSIRSSSGRSQRPPDAASWSRRRQPAALSAFVCRALFYSSPFDTRAFPGVGGGIQDTEALPDISGMAAKSSINRPNSRFRSPLEHRSACILAYRRQKNLALANSSPTVAELAP